MRLFDQSVPTSELFIAFWQWAVANYLNGLLSYQAQVSYKLVHRKKYDWLYSWPYILSWLKPVFEGAFLQAATLLIQAAWPSVPELTGFIILLGAFHPGYVEWETLLKNLTFWTVCLSVTYIGIFRNFCFQYWIWSWLRLFCDSWSDEKDKGYFKFCYWYVLILKIY